MGQLPKTNPEYSKAGKQKKVSNEQTWILDEHMLVINKNIHKVIADKKELNLTPAEWKILLFLTDNPDQVFSREQLLEKCFDYYVSARTIDTHIKNLRNKLSFFGWINTVRSFGYSFKGKLK